MSKPNIDEKYMYYIRIVGKLVIISACVALIIGVVNHFTSDKIETNRMAKFMNAVNVIFPDSDAVNRVDITVAPPVDTVYKVSQAGESLGYCMKVLPKGFNGEIELIVGTDLSGTVLGVRIIAHSETSGIGSRVNNESYLSGYKNKTGQLRLNSDISNVAGATVSSKAILSGVNAVLAIEGLYDDGGTE